MSKKVAVIDGNSLMHRAYHAIQTPMSAPDGTPTNAVFGFMQMLCKFVETAHPDALVCAFDAGKPEFRMQELPTYKAQRPHMDDELRRQFPVVEKLLEAMRVPVVKVPGWEGDDILGTVAARDEALGYQTLLVTGDKDACQLATELTHIVTTKKGISDVAIMGPDEVMEKYGVSPAQFTDFLGLMGDKSDNIPGVTGVGPKSATTLLEKYGTIEGIYEHLDELRGKQRERLEEERDLAFLSRQIATIVTDLDFPLDLESIVFPAFVVGEVEAAFKSYSLMSPLARVLSMVGGTATADMVELDPGPLHEGASAQALLEQALSSGECLGIALDDSGQDSLFETSLQVAVSTSEGVALFSGAAAEHALVAVIRTAPFSVLDSKEMAQRVYPADSACAALVDETDLVAMRAFDLGLAAYALNSTVSDYTHDQLAQRYLGGMLETSDDQRATLAQSACASRL